MHCPYLPVGEEDDTFDGEEFEDWVVGPEKILGGEVEEEESIESDGDAEVVDEGDVDIGVAGGPVAVLIEVEELEKDDDEGHEGLDDAELEGALLAESGT